ncbi:MAG: metallophosphoesterase family protein [Ktedonobacteraceae bacterium]|nr:metallophosphoesterase family protein [Ktedonobacteraceae bacterium]
MKIAAIYDIHGNLPALEAVLEEIDRATPDVILVGGDVALGPMPRETVERLMTLETKARFVRGNTDRVVVDCFDGKPLSPRLPENVRQTTLWTAQQLERQHRDFLAAFENQVAFSIEGLGAVLFCHATPRSDEELFTVASPAERLQEIFADVRQDVVVCGHTHMQFDRQVGSVRVVNAGSVGMPYGEPGAYWALPGPGPQIVLQRTSYDFEMAANLIRASQYPQAQDFADNNILHPPSAAEATALFERMVARNQ